jgi:hypothetical protein
MKIRSAIKPTVLLAGLLFSVALPSFGQSGLPRHMYGLAFGGLFPVGDFNDHVSQDGFGVGLYYGWRLRHTPLFMGVEFSVSLYGHSRREEFLEGIPEVPLDVVTENNIGQSFLFVRLQPRSGRVTTFVEGLAGISYFWTDTTITGHGLSDNDISSNTNFDDGTWAAGGGAGLSVRLGRPRVQVSGRAQRGAFLEFKVRYLAGGWANYLKKGSIVVEGNEFSFTPERSATSFVTAQAGFSWFF